MPTSLLYALLILGCVACSSVSPTGPDSNPWPDAPVFEGGASSGWWLESGATADDDEDEDEALGPLDIGWGILMYVPNRLLDALDMVRARLRLGPGFAVGARATEYADFYVGTYVSVYIGLPGPRGRKFPRLPVGMESKTGAEVSVVDATIEGGMSPDYGMTEFGFGFQALLLGIDVGVDPFEMLDFVVGFLTFDPLDDDF
jgi:hypothetical protein